MNNLLRKILIALLYVCAINGFAQQHVTAPKINSIKFEGVDVSKDNNINVCYTVSFNSSLKIGDKAYCYITPVDINGKSFPDGKGSFLTAGGLYNITQRGLMSLTIAVPAAIIKPISGTDKYHLKVNVMPEKDDDFFLEDLFSFSYSNLKREVCADAIQASFGLLDLILGGTDSGSSGGSESNIFKPRETKICDNCYGKGICRMCNADGSPCPVCASSGKCPKCHGDGRIEVSDN